MKKINLIVTWLKSQNVKYIIFKSAIKPINDWFDWFDETES